MTTKAVHLICCVFSCGSQDQYGSCMSARSEDEDILPAIQPLNCGFGIDRVLFLTNGQPLSCLPDALISLHESWVTGVVVVVVVVVVVAFSPRARVWGE